MAKVLLTTLFRDGRHEPVVPPLALLYIAAAVRAAGHEARVLDLRARRESVSQQLTPIKNFLPQVIVISAEIFDARVLRDAVAELRTHMGHARVVVVGPLAHGLTLECLQIPGVDAAVRGEGEEAIPRLIAAYVADEIPPVIAGVGYPGVAVGGEPEPIADLDALPFPAWDLVDVDLYQEQRRRGHFFKDQRWFTVLSSRGCQYGGVANLHPYGRTFRARSPESVVREIEELVWKYRIREIHFVDEGFATDLPRAKQIADLLAARQLDVALVVPAGPRADRLDRELIDKLAAAHCFRMVFDIETAAPRVQTIARNNANLSKLDMVFKYAAGKRIITDGVFALGFPGETDAEARATVDFALRSNLTLVSLHRVRPTPGSELWETAAHLGKTQDFDPAKAEAEDPPIHFAAATPKALKRLSRRGRWRFYLHPRRLWRIWRLAPRKRQFWGLISSRLSASGGGEA